MATAPADTNLRATVKLNLNTQYKRTDLNITPDDTVDNINFTDINHTFTNGSGDDKVNLQYHARRRLISTSEALDIDTALKNVWEQSLDFDAINVMVIRNRESTPGRFLTVTFKDEKYIIGPGGSRTIVEPTGRGIHAVTSSSSSEEGLLNVSADGDITYDLIILGSSQEESG